MNKELLQKPNPNKKQQTRRAFAVQSFFDENIFPLEAIFQFQDGMKICEWLSLQDQALVLASSVGHPFLVKYCLSKGINIDALNNSNCSALMMASQNGNVGIVQQLLSGGAKVNLESVEGETALMIALNCRHPSIVMILMIHGGLYSKKRNPFVGAAEEGHIEMIKALLSIGAPINIQGKDGLTGVMAAAAANHLEVVQALINAGCDVNLQSSTGMTALILSAKHHGNIDICTALMDASADIDHQNQEGKSALYFSVRNNNKELTEIFLAAGASVDVITSKGQTILLASAKSGDANMVKLVLEVVSDEIVNKTDDKNGETPLVYASRKGYEDVVEVLLWHGDGNCDLEFCSGDDGATPLICAASAGHLETVMVLIEYGADKNAQDFSGFTALMYALLGHHERIVQYLISEDVDLSLQNELGDTVLNQAIALDDVGLVDELISLGVDLDTKNIEEETPLIRASKQRNQLIFNALVDAGASIDAQSSHGRTALMTAACCLHFPYIEKLVASKANVHLYDSQGENALLLAAKAGTQTRSSVRIVEALIQAGSDLSSKDGCGRTVTMASALVGDSRSVLSQLRSPALSENMLYEIDNNGKTTLMYLSELGNLEAVEEILKRAPVLVEKQDLNGFSALMCAARKGFSDVVKRLCKAGASLNLRNDLGVDALYEAICETEDEPVTGGPFMDCIQILLENGAAVEASHIEYAMKLNNELLALKLEEFKDAEK